MVTDAVGASHSRLLCVSMATDAVDTSDLPRVCALNEACDCIS